MAMMIIVNLKLGVKYHLELNNSFSTVKSCVPSSVCFSRLLDLTNILHLKYLLSRLLGKLYIRTIQLIQVKGS